MGIFIVVNLVQPWNIKGAIAVNWAGKVTVIKLVQFWNILVLFDKYNEEILFKKTTPVLPEVAIWVIAVQFVKIEGPNDVI